MKKKLLVVLASVSMLAPALRADDSVSTVADVAPVVTVGTSSSSRAEQFEAAKQKLVEILAKRRTIARCVVLFTMKNLSDWLADQLLPGDEAKNIAKGKLFNTLSTSDYAMHIVNYFLTTRLPSSNDNTSTKLAEFIAKDLKAGAFTYKNKKGDVIVHKGLGMEAIRIFLKAGSRKQWFLPETSGTREMLRSPFGMIMMPVIEGLVKDTFKTRTSVKANEAVTLTAYPIDHKRESDAVAAANLAITNAGLALNATPQSEAHKQLFQTKKGADEALAMVEARTINSTGKVSPAKAVRPIMYSFVGQVASNAAEDVLLNWKDSMSKNPQLAALLNTDAGFELIKNIFGQLLEDLANKGINTLAENAEA